MFVEAVHFKNAATKDLTLIDLNQIQNPSEELKESNIETVFDESVCFHPDEQRSYLYMLKPVIDKKIVNSMEHVLGSIVITWKNYFGDHGQLELCTIKNTSFSAQLSKADPKNQLSNQITMPMDIDVQMDKEASK